MAATSSSSSLLLLSSSAALLPFNKPSISSSRRPASLRSNHRRLRLDAKLEISPVRASAASAPVFVLDLPVFAKVSRKDIGLCKLYVLDEKWIQVIFEPPELKFGPFMFQYGGQSEVELEITYIDEKVRLGKGSRGSLFIFVRR